MGPLVPSAPPALWVPGCLALLLWLWVLCAACYRKRAPRQGSVTPEETPVLSRPYLSVLSKSDTRLHEVPRGTSGRGWAAPRPASVSLLHQWSLEVSPATLSHPDLPPASPAAANAQPSLGPEATYSNVGLAAIPRACLAASPVVWAGARLTSSWARPGPEARPEVAEYACIQKLKGADRGPQGPEQGKAQGTPATQVDLLYSRVSKPRRKGPGPANSQSDPTGWVPIPALGRDLSHEAVPLRGPSTDCSPQKTCTRASRRWGSSEGQPPPAPASRRDHKTTCSPAAACIGVPSPPCPTHPSTDVPCSSVGPDSLFPPVPHTWLTA